MSGRVRIRRDDGEWVTGYRKTDRRNPRATPAVRPEYRLIFQLPRELAWSTTEGKYGSVVIGQMNNVTVTSFDRDFALKSAAEFLQGISKGHDYLAISAVMQRSHSEQAPSARDTVQMVLARGNVVVWFGAGRHKVFLSKR